MPSTRTLNILLIASTLFVALAFPVAYMLHANKMELVHKAVTSIGVLGALVNLFSWSVKLADYVGRRRAARTQRPGETPEEAAATSLARETDRLLRERGL